jgi:hypothetical protein
MGGAFIGDPAPNQLFVNPINEADDRARHAVTLRLGGRVGEPERAARPRPRGDGERGTVGTWSGRRARSATRACSWRWGLGDDDDVVERVEIDWPAGGREVVEGVPADSVVSIREGEGVVGARPYAPVAIE